MPRGGFYLWCHLPDGCDTADVARASFMRFNVAQCDDPIVMEVLERATERCSPANR